MPSNTTNASYGYVGQHQKLTEGFFFLTPIQMGARLYLPTVGRFTQVDPIEGGVDNNYVYPGDPVNGYDLDGRAYISYDSSFCLGFCMSVSLAQDKSNGARYVTTGFGIGTAGFGYGVSYGPSISSGYSIEASAGFYGAGGSMSYDKRGASWRIGSGGKKAGASLMVQQTSKVCRNRGCGGVKIYKKDSRFLSELRNGRLKNNYKKKVNRRKR